MDKQYRHIFSLIISVITLVAASFNLDHDIASFNDFMTFVLSFVIAGLIYYGMIRGVVELINLVGE